MRGVQRGSNQHARDTCLKCRERKSHTRLRSSAGGAAHLNVTYKKNAKWNGVCPRHARRWANATRSCVRALGCTTRGAGADETTEHGRGRREGWGGRSRGRRKPCSPAVQACAAASQLVECRRGGELRLARALVGGLHFLLHLEFLRLRTRPHERSSRGVLVAGHAGRGGACGGLQVNKGAVAAGGAAMQGSGGGGGGQGAMCARP